MAIDIKSFNQILGEMIRKVISQTPLNDVNPGSVLLTLLEACAAQDFENNASILNLLELLNVDLLKNNDLNNKAADLGLQRQAAIRASGAVTIYNSNITKRSTGLYIIKPAPIAGQLTLYVNNTDGWAATGSLYIGRGTNSFEGPINYTAITQFLTYSQITLASALQKDHLISDAVVDAQSQPDRVVAAGTQVKVLANNQNPEIIYTLLRDAVLAAGEDRVENVAIICSQPGTIGNASINTITSFGTIPFSGATVSNTSTLSDGRDIETDTELRNRVKSYTITLARGTAPAIVSAILGISDPDDNKQVASAVITEPVTVGDPSILYIDDGKGFQPSYVGQTVDILVSNANGTEEFLQLANFPLPRPQVVNAADGPFTLIDSMSFGVTIDDKEETIVFDVSDFLNISAATMSEIIIAINTRAETFKARFTENSSRMLIYPVAHDAEIIQVVALKTTDDSSLYANTLFKFPTTEASYIALYQNSTRLREKSKAATVETTTFAAWNIISAGNLTLSVDGTPTQDQSFTLSDFPDAATIAGLTLEEWVVAFNAKFAGITAAATSSQTMTISSNRIGDESTLEIVGGTYLTKMFPNQDLSSVGQTSEFELNRQTGNIRILGDILSGDNISAGVEDAKGFVISTATTSGTYNVSNDGFGRPAEMILLLDSECVQRQLIIVVGGVITISNPSGSIMRIMSNTLSAFASLQPGDFIYIVSRTSSWFSPANTGVFKIFSKGKHTIANTDSYVEVINNGVIAESATILDSLDIKAFSTNGYPQVWRGSYAANPPAATMSDLVDSINNNILNIKASVFRSNSIKLTSTTEENGSIAVPVIVGNLVPIFTETSVEQIGNPSHVANRVSEKSLFGYFERTTPTSTNVWLNRDVFSSINGALTANANPDSPPFSATYSETVASSGVLTTANVKYSDMLTFTRGNNRNQIRSIKAKIAVDSVGTQQGLARTEFDHIIGDEVLLMNSLQFASDDSIVFVLDKDTSAKTIDIKIARTGQINSGSNMLAFLPTTTEFSANDVDNEPGIDFSNTNVWGTTVNGTNFADYAVLMRARNWYSTGGVAGVDGKMMIRAYEYGANGDALRFNIKYPGSPDLESSVVRTNTPSYNLYSYYFGSGSAKPIALTAGDTIAVVGPYPNSSTNFPNGAISSGNYFDYTFSTGNFAPVIVGDVLSIQNFSGVSSFNRGQFRVANKSGNTVRVFNPTASVTAPGLAEVSTLTVNPNAVGTRSNNTMNIPVGGSFGLDGTYIVLYDNAGSIKVWFDVDNNGTPEPVTPIYNRTIKIATLITGDTQAMVATKIGAYLSNDPAFVNVFVTTIQVIYDVAHNGFTSSPTDGNTSLITFSYVPGTPDTNADGEYILLYDDVGSVAVWFDIDNDGTPEPFHGADRSLKVSTIVLSDGSAAIAAKIATIINSDAKFNAVAAPTQVITTATFSANTQNATAGTTAYAMSSIDGSSPIPEVISNTGLLNIFALVDTSTTAITDKINETNIIKAAPIGSGSLTITKSTKEDDYTYGGNSTALGYGHNPGSTTLREYISLYDGINWVKTFSNSNPNFTLKTAMTLNGVAPTVYAMDTTPNEDSTTGEYIKLVPTTIANIDHHLTQKALSQLPIISNIDISNAGKNVQVKSKQLGSSGALEIIGGRANIAQTFVIGESETATDVNGARLLLKVSAFPETFSIGDTVKIENASGVNRLSRLLSSDSINVVPLAADLAEYQFNPKVISFIISTTIAITDISATYSKPAGTVWRWTHGGGGATLANVRAGDLVMAYGTLTGWDQGNKMRIVGDNRVAGLPIIAVNDGGNWFDVVNPYGKAMVSTAIGATSTVQIVPTPIIQWNLDHIARVQVSRIERTLGTTITIDCETPHLLNTGDSVSFIDIDSVNLSNNIVYGPITATSSYQFTFTSAGTNFIEDPTFASLLKDGSAITRYRIERFALDGLTRLTRQDGDSPRFADCGVAVDDYMVISGDTFKSNNGGRFRVLAVDNNSILFENESSSDELNTIKTFNNKGTEVDWTANSNLVTGIAGAFKYLSIGDWVKKDEDVDTAYVQVIAFTPGTAAAATQITLGGNYSGTTGSALGIAYDQSINYDKGVYLQSTDDISFYEGDAIVNDDTLFIQNIIDINWFNPVNIGNFTVMETGTNDTTFKPFIRINNPVALAESNRLMSVNISAFYLVEGVKNKFYTYRKVDNSPIDDVNDEKRAIYLSPSSRSYKFSEANNTMMSHTGKLGYNTDVTIGIDGYLYYTGLLRRVQRTVDGFEPDASNYPGRRAVGGFIETLPPLVKDIVIALNATTSDGVNLGDISDNIKSAIIDYVTNLGVGEDVILSEIIAAVMQIKGVGAVTFTNPIPSTERITIANNEKATISPSNIGIS